MYNYRWIPNIIIGTIIFVFQSGCANQNSIHRSLDINEGKGVLIDIKQRAIIVKNRTVNDKTIPVVCAEPSPDALSAFASALSGKVDVYSKVSVGGESQTQENASFVGLRTQSIQLLRDFLYRDCEAYLNEAIDKYQYDVLMRRNQKYMVALLGIEQLTGAIASSSSTLKASLQSNEDEKKNKTNGAADGLTTETKPPEISKKTSTKTSKKDAPAKNDEPTKKEESVKKVDLAEVNNIELVASVVNNIVTHILQTDDIGQSCFAYLAGIQNTTNNKLANICSDYLSKAADKKLDSKNISNTCIDILTKVVSSGAKASEVMILMDKLTNSYLCIEPGGPIMKSMPTNLNEK